MFRRKWVGLPSTLTLKGWGGIGTESSLATAAEAGDRLSHEAMNPGTGEIDEAPSVDAGPDRPSVAQGAAVILSGSGTDPGAGEVLIHAWIQGEHAPTVKR